MVDFDREMLGTLENYEKDIFTCLEHILKIRNNFKGSKIEVESRNAFRDGQINL